MKDWKSGNKQIDNIIHQWSANGWIREGDGAKAGLVWDLGCIINDLLSSQLKEVVEVIESKRKAEVYVNLERADNPSYISGEEYNQALDDIKAEVKRLGEIK
jgi:hypothetical protein